MSRFVAFWVLGLVLSGCEGNRRAQVAEGLCAAPSAPWRTGAMSPPNRVIAFDVVAQTRGLVVNGALTPLPALRKKLDSARPLRPSPYLNLSYRDGLGCADLDGVAKLIDSHFDCEANYCFFAGRLRTPK